MADLKDTNVFGDLKVFGSIFKENIEILELYKSKQLGSGIKSSGSNSNGEYIRFVDGVQFAWELNKTIRTTGKTNNESIYIESDMVYPATFIEEPIVVPTQFRDAGIQWSGVRRTSSTSADIYLIGGVGSTSLGKIGYFAFGRWK